MGNRESIKKEGCLNQTVEIESIICVYVDFYQISADYTKV